MIGLGLGLFVAGILMSAFFSGSETGFYRASRVRWVLDGLEGDRVAQLFIVDGQQSAALRRYVARWKQPGQLFDFAVNRAHGPGAVRRIAIGGVGCTAFVDSHRICVWRIIAEEPFLPCTNRLLRWAGPVYLMFFFLFAPIIGVLFVFGRFLERLLGHSPEKVRLTLARKELDQLLKEGEEAGILHPTQRQMSQNFFLIAAKPVSQQCQPIARIHSLPRGTPVRRAISYAQRFRLANIVIHQGTRTNVVGYVRTIDLLLALDHDGVIHESKELMEVKGSEHAGEVIMRMQTRRVDLAKVLNTREQVVGILSLTELTDPLIKPAAG